MTVFRRLGLIGCALAILVIGLILLRNYRLDEGVRAMESGDYKAAFNELRPLAYLGDSPAQYILGEMCAFGFGVQKDDTRAIYWFRRAGILKEGGVDPAAPAELAVSRAYAEGMGVKADADESLKWLRRAAAGGNKEAISRLQSFHAPQK